MNGFNIFWQSAKCFSMYLRVFLKFIFIGWQFNFFIYHFYVFIWVFVILMFLLCDKKFFSIKVLGFLLKILDSIWGLDENKALVFGPLHLTLSYSLGWVGWCGYILREIFKNYFLQNLFKIFKNNNLKNNFHWLVYLFFYY
jgi:hypothetical protein